MNVKEILKNVKYKLKTEGSDYDFEKEIYQLTKILSSDVNNTSVYNYLGKIYYRTKNYEEAINVLLKSNKIKVNESNLYYLFKCYAANKNYEKAQETLCEYEKITSIKEFNGQLIFSILKAINSDFNEFSLVNDREFFNMFNIKDSILCDKYEEFIKAYNEKKFEECIKVVEEINILINKNKIPLDFRFLRDLLIKLNDVYVKKQEKDNFLMRFDDFNKSNYEELTKLLKFKNANKNYVETLIRNLILDGYLNEVVDLVENKLRYWITKKDLKEYKNFINNAKTLYEMPEEYREIYEYCLIKGHYYMKYRKNYELAYDIYSYGYYITEHPLLLYYMGRCCYLSLNYYDAKKLFEEYLLYDKKKEYEAKWQLYEITKKKIYKVSRKLNPIERDALKDFDFRKRKVSNELVMTVDDFENKR